MTEQERSSWFCIALPHAAALILAIGTPTPAGASPLSATEARGKALYFSGIGANGKPVKAFIGEESSSVGADAVPCSGCHGEDGRGRPEGGIVPSDITWSYLTKPYGHRHGNYRQHPAFTEKTLADALTRGIDPGGNPLDASMPRFAMSRADMAGLIAYLKRLDSDLMPGIDDTTIRLGTILPVNGEQQAVGTDLPALLRAYFDEINSRGGIFNRRIELEVTEVGPSPESTLSHIRRLIESDRIFALLSTYVPYPEQSIADLLEKSGVPVIGPITDFPRTDSRSAFYLFEGIEFRARALLDHAISGLKLESPRLALIYPDHETYQGLATRIESEAAARKWPKPIRAAYGQGPGETYEMARSPALHAADAVIFWGSEDAIKAWAKASDAAQWHPYVLFPGMVIGKGLTDLPPALLPRILFTLPFTAENASPGGLQTLQALQRKSGLGDRSLYAETFALAGAHLLVEALKQVGRDLSRRKLIGALETLRDVEAGPMSPLSYSPSDHMGLSSVQIVAIDAATRRFRRMGSSDSSP